MRSHVDRLAAHLRSTPDADLPIAGRVGGALWIVGGLTTVVISLLPQGGGGLDLPTAALCTVAVTWGLVAIFAIDWRTAPAWGLPTATAAATVAIVAMTALTGGQTSPARLFGFFALVFAASFLKPLQVAATIVLCAAGWEFPVLTAPGGGAGDALMELTVALPIFAVLGGVILGGRELLTSMRASAERLSEEHHAMRTLATAVAASRDPVSVCNAASEQAALLLRADGGGILRFLDGDEAQFVGAYPADRELHPPGFVLTVPRDAEVAQVRRSGRPVRVDDYGSRTDTQAKIIAQLGFRAWVGSPVYVRGRLWGAIAVMAARPNSLPADAEQHLSEFAELVGMAIVNTEEVERLNADATTDPLTGLANHRAFQERLRAELSRAERHGRAFSVALVDIDHFKAVNDAGGHAAGDDVLRSVADHLRDQLRDQDVLARVGGDEFAILLPEAGGDEAAAALERARQAVERGTFAGGIRLTISAGVCDVAHGTDAESLTRFADGALYWSKEHGRNQVSAYDPATIQELSAAERVGQLQRSQALVGIRALARAIDARDPSTSRHSERVAELAVRMAEQCGWSSDRVALLHEAALVHDVGKIGIPDAILLKPSRLTREEYEVVKQHADLGARIVEDVLLPEQVEWILSHHERPDGLGYPRALRGDELSEGGALLAAADAFDVMVAERPYSAPRTVEDALTECRELAGRQFSAEAVAALEAVHASDAAPAPLQLAA